MKTKQLLKSCLLIILPITCFAQVHTDASNNVGIGTQTPRGVFDVAKDGDVYLSATPNGGSPQSTFLSGHIYLAPYGPNDISYIQARRLDNSGTTSIRFRTYNAGQKVEALHIGGNGNIGIGITTPYRKLHLFDVGDVEQMIEANNDGYASLTLKSNEKMWHWSKRPSTEGDALRLFYHDGNNWQSPYMSFSTNGYVGIGTVNPQTKLHVDGNQLVTGDVLLQKTNSVAGLTFHSGVNHSSIQFLKFGTKHAGIVYNGRQMIFKGMSAGSDHDPDQTVNTTETVETIFMGNVGIGTTDPEAALQVTGEARIHQKGWFGRASNGALASNLRLGQNQQWDAPIVDIQTADEGGTNEARWLGTRYGHHVKFQRNSSLGVKTMLGLGGDDGQHYLSVFSRDGVSEKIKLIPDGNSFIQGQVGIGTDNPGSFKLAVEGKVGARKVVVTQNNWADYVFEPTYQLPSLNEVEAFIKANKHLPDVPPAKEVEKNGLDLGDNQAVLLKKIEELTLYAIEADKKNKELKEENKLLEARLKMIEAKLGL